MHGRRCWDHDGTIICIRIKVNLYLLRAYLSRVQGSSDLISNFSSERPCDV